MNKIDVFSYLTPPLEIKQLVPTDLLSAYLLSKVFSTPYSSVDAK
jgi:hypothetical protein